MKTVGYHLKAEVSVLIHDVWHDGIITAVPSGSDYVNIKFADHEIEKVIHKDYVFPRKKRCRVCEDVLPDRLSSGSDCTNCWEVSKRLGDFAKSKNGKRILLAAISEAL
jgi:hypothetical protein